jgi:pyrroloquinoline quinone biosynthesis protein B
MVDWMDLPQEFVFAGGTVTAVVLGIMQDGGLPHAGCRCERCVAAFNEPGRAEYASCLALVDTRTSAGSASASAGTTAVYLIDATPDIKQQLNLLAQALGPHPTRPNRLRQPDGVFITHAHAGHLSGLFQLGTEMMAVDRLPVYVPAALGGMMYESPLWLPLLQNLRVVPLSPGQYLDLAADVQITAVPVPHRDELGAGTFAFKIQGPNRSLLYLPDIDSWEEWPDAEAVLRSVDVALVDGTFFSADEVNGRTDIPHPFIPDTLKRFAKLDCDLRFIHLNHTNPVLDSDSQSRFLMNAAGAQLAQTGQMFRL